MLSWHLLPRFATAVPATPNLQDAHVLPWVLAWVAHALATAPGALFDANVSHPAPLQLTGTDPLLAWQLGFAPLYAASGNAVLATNLVVWLCYPLSAFALERLLRRAGVTGLAAWVVGLAFALGVQRVPFNLNALALPNVVLPWLALALGRLRDAPDARRAAMLLVAFVVAVLASLYDAVLAGIFCAVWGTWQLLRPERGRGRFVAWCGLVVVAGGGVLLLVLLPYLATLDARSGAFPSGTRLRLPLASPGELAVAATLVLGNLAQSVHLAQRELVEVGVLVASACVAIVAWLRRLPVARALVPPALVLWLVFALLAWGYPGPVDRLVSATPLRAFRYVHRFSVLADLGLLLLLAVALEAVRARAGSRRARVASAAILLVVLWSRGVPFARTPMHEVAAFTPASRAAYDATAAVRAREGGGALLELPIWGPLPGTDGTPQTLEPDAMLASTLHWWPTPAAHLSYHAPLRAFFQRSVAAIDEPRVLDDLIDATHVRWLLLRPEWAWRPGERARVRDALLASDAVGASYEVAPGWTLLRLDRVPTHPAWFEAQRRGAKPGISVLGSSLERLPDEAARASVRIEGDLHARVRPGKLPVTVSVRNDGDRPWAVLATPATPLTLDGRLPNLVRREGTVALRERWWRLLDDRPHGAPVAERRQPLTRDIDPGETVREQVSVLVPTEPGDYLLELGVEQVDGARFEGAGNDFARRRLTVVAGDAAPGDGAAGVAPPSPGIVD